MLLLFLYPLRKAAAHRAAAGVPTRGWFAMHMVLGVAGPLLVILHSTLHFGSLNATVAFASMALVAGQRVVGRFLYARIHHGLYGEQATLEALALQARERGRRRARAARVRTRGRDSGSPRSPARADRGTRRPSPSLRFFLLGFAAWRTRRRGEEDIAAVLEPRARDEAVDRGALRRRLRRRSARS